MSRLIRCPFAAASVLSLLGLAACSSGSPAGNDAGANDAGFDAGAVDAGPCGRDCSKISTAQCTVAVCNTGQLLGPINTCVVVPSPNGMPCDAGDLCLVNDACDGGVCAGQPKDCSSSPLNECNQVACDPASGACRGTPDPNKDGTPCSQTGDACSVSKACDAGQCGGGTPKDCSALTLQCQVGVCDEDGGACVATTAAPNTACTQGVNDDCHFGTCNATGVCNVQTQQNGATCNAHDACTSADQCSAGVCGGVAVTGCKLWFQEGFENCPDGWTFGGDWQCGTPTSVGPPLAHTGHGVIATVLAGNYNNNDSFSTCVANSPSIDLTTATSPTLSFWVWQHTEGGTFDGWNLKISAGGGAFAEVNTVTPAYPLTILGQPAWGGDGSALGWQNYTADLSPYAGQSVFLQFAFRSDSANVDPGVYIDDIVIAEPVEVPLYVSTASLPAADAGAPYTAQLSRTGGSAAATWSLVDGGTNASWAALNPATGVLQGTPSTRGPVVLTVKVAEPSLPSNYDQKTFDFTVR